MSANETKVVHAGMVTVVISGFEGLVRLDGRERSTQSADFGRLFSVDLARSTGFHHLQLGDQHDYWFGTEDAKLRLEGIVAMLRYLAREALGWTGQLVFSDGNYLRDPHVTYGWLDQHADAALGAVEAIAAAPRRGRTSVAVVTSHQSRRIALRPTLALLRRRGSELLTANSNGPLLVQGVRYTPRRVVALTSADTLDTLENRRALWLARRIGDLAAEVGPGLPGPERNRCAEWRSRARRVLTTSSLSTLAMQAVVHAPSPVRATVELSDPHYSVSYEKATRLFDLTGWSAAREPRSAYAYVAYADEIYQAFVAHAIARALALRPTAVALGLHQPAFEGADWRFFYDCAPPIEIIRTWRSYSLRPDRPKPDVLLERRTDGAVLLGDAKYRNSGERASDSSYHDIFSYMAAFGLMTAFIAYPPVSGVPDVHRVEGQGRVVVEFAIAPHEALSSFMVDTFAPIAATLAATAAWRR